MQTKHKPLANQTKQITQAILAWFDQFGRKTLPWQKRHDHETQNDHLAYRVWLSEIMLQQTQVNTVIPYFNKFIARFPDIASLAAASQDEVLHYWSGLGYYARARNLHKAAQIIVQQHNNQFPKTFDEVLALPGIGRSTAGAILAFVYNQHFAILDGNVKRVLARLYGIEKYPGEKATEAQMWQFAFALTPKKRVADYTQAIMDLGATVCKRTKPLCESCPIQTHCAAFAHSKQHILPIKKPKKTRPNRYCNLWLIRNSKQQILLQKRAPSGIWGGLWTPPIDDSLESILAQLSLKSTSLKWQALTPIKHQFTHFTLHITPYYAEMNTQRHTNINSNTTLSNIKFGISESKDLIWYRPNDKNTLGLPAPVLKLLEKTL